MSGTKVCVIGGGSTYTPELLDGLLRRRDDLDLAEVHLVDVDPGRLAVLGPLSARMSDRAGGGVTVRWGTDRAEGLRGARFVVSQVRVGGMAARERDEQLGREFGLIGQETVGVGGLANAWRTIPFTLALAADVAAHAPGATLLNFTNPAGLVTEALCRHATVPAIGLCNVPWTVRTQVAASLGVDAASVSMDYVGLNHLSWVRRIHVDGIDRTGEVLARLREAAERHGVREADAEPSFGAEALSLIDAVPNPYLRYFYETDAFLEHQRLTPTRASAVRAIEDELLRRSADPGLDRPPAELAQRGGAHYSEAAAALMADLVRGDGAVHVVNTPNRGAIPGLGDDVVVEVAARILGDGPHPLPVAPLRADVDALVRTVKDVELLAVQAAVDGDEHSAMRALVTHPLGPPMSRVRPLWNRLRELNRGQLGALG